MINFSKKNIITFLIGIIMGVFIILLALIFSNNAPFLKAAEVDSGAADVNARYLDGYGTAIATSSNKIYISDASGYLPDGSIDTGSILDGTIVNADVNNSAAIDVSKTTGARLSASASADITVTTTMCSSAPCKSDFDTCTKICTSQGYVLCDHYHSTTCASPGWNAPKSWDIDTGNWISGTACAYDSHEHTYEGDSRIYEVTCYR